jgi:hypothetical protein
MPPTTLRGVTLFTKGRDRTDDVFDIAISPEGIAILRPDQEVRLLEWSRVATWELEQRRRRVLMILRGGGSVTPLMIPDWTVDDLDQVLQEATAHLVQAGLGPEEIEPDALAVPTVLVEAVEAIEPVEAAEPMPGPDVGLDVELDDEAGIEGEVHAGLDLELPEPTPIDEDAPLADMDLTLPAPAAAGPGDGVKEMDLSLSPPPPVPDPAAFALASEEDGDGEAPRSGG